MYHDNYMARGKKYRAAVEKIEKDKIDAYLKKIEGLYLIKPASGGFGVSGTPDRVGCFRSLFFAIEVKRAGKEPTPIQWKRIKECQDAGGKAFWGTSEKVIPEFEQWRNEISVR